MRTEETAEELHLPGEVTSGLRASWFSLPQAVTSPPFRLATLHSWPQHPICSVTRSGERRSHRGGQRGQPAGGSHSERRRPPHWAELHRAWLRHAPLPPVPSNRGGPRLGTRCRGTHPGERSERERVPNERHGERQDSPLCGHHSPAGGAVPLRAIRRNGGGGEGTGERGGEEEGGGRGLGEGEEEMGFGGCREQVVERSGEAAAAVRRTRSGLRRLLLPAYRAAAGAVRLPRQHPLYDTKRGGGQVTETHKEPPIPPKTACFYSALICSTVSILY